MTIADFFAEHPVGAVAFSGGVDSAALLALAVRHARRTKAYFVRTAFQPAFELRDAEDTARRLARCVSRCYGIRETVMRTMVCLEVLDEHGLIQVEQSTDHLRISVQEVSGKVDLEASKLLRHLRRLAEEA